jgi:hypothetical protein
MNIVRCALCTVLVAASVTAVARWNRSALAQDKSPNKGQATPAPADGDYEAADPDGNYQKALEAAVKKAETGLSKGGQVADQRFHWTVVSVSGTRGGITGSRDVSVKVHATL